MELRFEPPLAFRHALIPRERGLWLVDARAQAKPHSRRPVHEPDALRASLMAHDGPDPTTTFVVAISSDCR